MKLPRLLALFLSISLFIILPFIFSFRLQDIEQSPRFLVLAFIVTAASIVTLVIVNRKNFYIRFDNTWIPLLILCFLFYTGLFKSISTGDALFECLKLTLFIALFFLFTLSVEADDQNKLIYIKGTCIAALIFILFGCYQLWTPAITALKNGNL
jgi:hypothetical protein